MELIKRDKETGADIFISLAHRCLALGIIIELLKRAAAAAALTHGEREVQTREQEDEPPPKPRLRRGETRGV